MLTLTITHQRELKARAHTLNPVVMIGKTVLSASVIEELNRGLLSHELIKVKAQIDDRIARNALFEEICQQLDAAPVQHIGKIFIIYGLNLKIRNLLIPGKKKREPSRLNVVSK